MYAFGSSVTELMNPSNSDIHVVVEFGMLDLKDWPSTTLSLKL